MMKRLGMTVITMAALVGSIHAADKKAKMVDYFTDNGHGKRMAEFSAGAVTPPSVAPPPAPL